MTEAAFPSPFGRKRSKTREATGGGGDETRWVEVATTPGLTAAHIIVGRLKAEGIPSYAWQDGASAFGLTVGILGTGHVMVPEAYETLARSLLEDDDQAAVDEDTT